MKNIIKSLALVAAAAFVASCDLSESNPNEHSAGMAFANELNVSAAAASFNGQLTSLAGTYNNDFGCSDYLIANSLSSQFQTIYNISNLGEWAQNDWEDLRKINYYLTMLNSSVCGISGSVKENYEAVGRFFRAKWYAGKVMEYGDIQWYDKVLLTNEESEMYKDRDSRDYIIKKINEDLDYAIEHLSHVSPDKTTPDKWCALFLKMQTCLNEASFRKYNKVTESVTGHSFDNYSVETLYSMAVDAAEEIIESGLFELESNYRDLFTSTSFGKEVLLGAATSGTILGSQNNYFNYSTVKSLVRPFINTYLMKDGSAYTAKAGYATETFAQEFANRDPRLSQTVRYPGYKFGKDAKSTKDIAAPDIVGNVAPLGYQIIKFVRDYALDGEKDQTSGLNDNGEPIYRYAEVLLDYAEAKAELGQLTDADWAMTIGALRKRAGITGGLTSKPVVVDPYIQKTFFPDVNDAVILEIRRERAIELCLEGTRLDDLLRWGHGNLLAELPWTGINFVGGLDTPIDIDDDGKADYYFSSSEKINIPSEYQNIHVLVNNELSSIKAENDGSVWHLSYTPVEGGRYFNQSRSLAPIPSVTINFWKNHGYTLTQNPGY